MVAALETHREAIAELCRQYQVRRLEVFGSAATGEFDPERSDFDFLVEFAPAPVGGEADRYFGLLEGLEALLGRPVDLVAVGARGLANPYFRATVDRSRRLLYAA